MPDTLRLAYIGAGGIANYQARYLKDIPGVQIVAAVDIKDQALEKFSANHGVKALYRDWREMLDKETVDAVSVCTPNGTHAQPTIDSLRSGRCVMVEKPRAMSVAECRSMIEAGKASGKPLVVGFQWRYCPAAQFMRRQVEDGVVGDILYTRVQALRRRGIPSWGVFGRKELQGGGPLIDIGVHHIEMAHYIMGKPRPVAACASTFTYLGDRKPDVKTAWGDWDWATYTVEDLAVGFVRFDTGAVMTVESSFAAHIEKDVAAVQILGTRGGLTSDPPRLFSDANGYMLDAGPSYVGKEDMFAVKMASFVDVAKGKAANRCPGEDGLAVQQILEGLYRSAAEGREVAIA
jgi:predicted dehydrogenase